MSDRGVPAAAAILDSAEAQAELVAAIDDARLAERADDIRSVGRRAAGLVGLDPEPQHDGAGDDGGEILIAADLGPAEVAELDLGVTGIALAAGGVSAHAAIVARSLGIPMVVGIGDALLAATPGSLVVVDGSDGVVFLSPASERIEAATLALSRRTARRAEAIASRELPSVTDDGHSVRVLANVSGAPELSYRPGGRRRGRRSASHRARLPRRARVAERGRAPQDAGPDPGAARGATGHRSRPRLRR